MDYRLKIFSWIVVTVVMGASLAHGEAACPEFRKSQEGFSLDSETNAPSDNLLLSHKIAPLKKCVASLFVEKVDAVFLFKIGVSQYLKGSSSFFSLNAVFGHVSINAP